MRRRFHTLMTPTKTAHARLDPRRPLVLDTRELGRRPGSMRRVQRVAPAPGQLGTALVRVPEGSQLRLDLRLEAVMEGVLVTGTVRASLAGECARCLGPLGGEVEVELQELYAYPDQHGASDEELPRLVEDLLDLEPELRDALVTDLPMSPHCREDCPGLCPDCGTRLADVGPGHAHRQVDLRWAALSALAGGSAQAGRSGPADRSDSNLSDRNVEEKD